ncbi:MAG: MFS transporter [Candidatus Thorarchaeota archaeon]
MSELKEFTQKELVESSLELESNEKNISVNKWKANIWKSYLINFIEGFHLISGILVPFFLTWGKLTFVDIMFLQSYFTVMILVFEIPCGAIADYISRKFSLILGAIATAFAGLIYGSYPSIFIFAIGETLWAFGAALTSGTNAAFIYDTLRKLGRENEVSKISARNRSFSLLGIAISAPIGSLIGALFSLNLVMSLIFIPFFIATLISITLKEPNHDLETEKKEKYTTIIKSGVSELTKNKILRILAVEMVITESLVFFLIWTYQVYLEALNFQLIFFGFVSTLMTVMQIIFNNIIPTLETKLNNKRRFLQIYTIIPGIAFILMAIIQFIPVSIPLILIVIGFGFSRSLIFVKGINKQIETDNRATVLSTINMIASLIRAILYPLVGYLVIWSLNATFIMLGTLIIVFALLSRIKSENL